MHLKVRAKKDIINVVLYLCSVGGKVDSNNTIFFWKKVLFSFLSERIGRKLLLIIFLIIFFPKYFIKISAGYLIMVKSSGV